MTVNTPKCLKIHVNRRGHPNASNTYVGLKRAHISRASRPFRGRSSGMFWRVPDISLYERGVRERAFTDMRFDGITQSTF